MTIPTVHDLSCAEVALAVWNYLDGEMTAERASRIRAHLDTCDHCRDMYTFEGAFLRTVTRMLDEPGDLSALRRRIVDALGRHHDIDPDGDGTRSRRRE
jgi:anti-sigma factor (TIGR02949 family)